MIRRVARHWLVRAGIGCLLLAGVAIVAWATVAGPGHAAERPPDIPPVAHPGPPSRQPRPPATPNTTRSAWPAALARSTPILLDVPAIGVHSRLLQLGVNPDGTVQVPPFGPVSRAGWYRYSPTPGQLGPAIILGHVDSAAYGPGVFYHLGALRRGDTIRVTRADHRVAVFRVDSVAEYPKDRFPTARVYGDTGHPALRLITCGGSFDAGAGSYRDNIVVYASLQP